MKNVVKTFTASAVAVVMLVQNVHAQIAIGGSSSNLAPVSSTSAVDNTLGEQKNNNAFSNIHPRAVKDFQKSFKGIINEEWSKPDDGYIASFTTDSVKTMVAYNRNGIRNHILQSYSEKKLPGEVRAAVKSVYYDYNIFNVVEIRFDNEPVYMIYMQDNTHLKTISVYNGEMKEVESYIRG